MAVPVIRAHSIEITESSVDGELDNVFLPKGTIIRWVAEEAIGECIVGDLAENYIFYSMVFGWTNDQMVLNRDVHGVNVYALDEGTLYFILPSGRVI